MIKAEFEELSEPEFTNHADTTLHYTKIFFVCLDCCSVSEGHSGSVHAKERTGKTRVRKHRVGFGQNSKLL